MPRVDRLFSVRCYSVSATIPLHRQQVLLRDGWRCQWCGTMSNLEVHHKQFRSHSGHDSEENLITLCSDCHLTMHARHF